MRHSPLVTSQVLPVVQSAAGQVAVKTVKPGDQLITVWSQQTAIKATVIR